MPTIDTNMSIFDSPVAAKQRAPPRTLHEEDERCYNEKNDSSSFHLDSNDDDNDPVNGHDWYEKETDKKDLGTQYELSGYMTTPDDNYQGLLKRAAHWKTTLHCVLDTVYKLRIEAAITLDKFAMMYPTQSVGDETQGQGGDDDMNIDGAVQSQVAQDGEERRND